MKSSNKMTRAQLLEIEKARLKKICEVYEAKLNTHIQDFRSHSFSMVLRSMLPLETGASNKIVKVLALVNQAVLPAFFGISFTKEKGNLSKNFMKLLRPLLISFSLKMLKKMFNRHQNKTTE